MINFELAINLLEFIKGRFNLLKNIFGIKAEPLEEKPENQDNLDRQLEKGNILVESYLTLRAGALLLADLAKTLSQPSISTVAIIAIVPPPVLMALYSLVALYQLYRIAKNIPQALDWQASPEQRQQAQIAIAHAALLATAAAALVVSNVFLPGITNAIALSCLASAAIVKVGVMVYQHQIQKNIGPDPEIARKKNIVLQELTDKNKVKQQKSVVLHEIKNLNLERKEAAVLKNHECADPCLTEQGVTQEKHDQVDKKLKALDKELLCSEKNESRLSSQGQEPQEIKLTTKREESSTVKELFSHRHPELMEDKVPEIEATKVSGTIKKEPMPGREDD